MLVEAGNRVPADGRLFVAATLEIEEAALTGESVASPKATDATPGPDVPLGDRHCMAFMNTAVTRGRGEMIVTGTGMNTEMGRIADLLNRTEADKTPLQKQLDRLTVIIAGLAGLAFVAMLILGWINDQDFDEVFLAGVALAISAIPTGMPAVVTTLYAMGTRVLASHNAIVKRLPSVETLGSVSAICSDKTGTLTLNKMTAREFTVPGHNHYTVKGEGYSTQGQLLHDGGKEIPLDEIMLPMALCADARLDGEALIGDPTEGALIVLAEKGGVSVDDARARFPRIAEVPFDSEYKFMATFHEMTDAQGRPVVRCFVKGAPDVLIARGALRVDARRRARRGHRREPPPRPRRERPHGQSRRAGHGRRPPRLRPRDLRPRRGPARARRRPHAAGDGRHRRPAPARGARRHRRVQERRHPGPDDHRRPRRHRGGDRPRAGHRRPRRSPAPSSPT